VNKPEYQKVFREKLSEHREEYFVTYYPADGDDWLATVSLSFPANVDLLVVKSALEKELKYWLKRFPVPIMVSAFDAKDNVIRLPGDSDESHLTGYVDIQSQQLVYRWGLMKSDEVPSEQKEASYLEWTYQGIPIRLQQKVREEALLEIRVRNRVIRFIVFFYVGGAVFVELIALGVSWLGHVLAVISISTGSYKLAKAMGWLKPSQRDKENAEKERKMEHYFYHCERNPEAFNHLRCENFERDTIEKTLKESETIRKNQKSNE
jgi:hypothetical protein